MGAEPAQCPPRAASDFLVRTAQAVRYPLDKLWRSYARDTCKVLEFLEITGINASQESRSEALEVILAEHR